MKEILFFEPIFKERIWGGQKLKEFGYNLPFEKTGECWAFSAHEHGQSLVKNGLFKGTTLGQLWKENRELFGDIHGEKFPLLTKILDANADLSVQVHPNDSYAHNVENGEFGKTECWYVIDCKENAELILGHHAQTKEELIDMLTNQKWDEFIRKIPIKPGDFIYVPSQTVHAICEGTLILETQQNSDVTYRVYDFDRTDDKGDKRELHIEKSIDVISVPHVDTTLSYHTEKKENATITTFVENEFFTVQLYDVNGLYSFHQNQNFMLVSVIEGEGRVNHQAFRKGDHFLVPYETGEVLLEGKAKLIVSYV